METKENKKEEKPKKEKKLTPEELLAAKDEEIASLKNKYLMAHADMDNMRKIYERDHATLLKYRAAGFIEELMPILDGFHHALQLEIKDETTKNFLIGFEFLYKQMLNVMEQEGVTKIEPVVGAPFDANSMHAIETEVSEGEPNRISKVLACGYKLKDRLVRPAMVVVTKKDTGAEKTEEKINQEQLG